MTMVFCREPMVRVTVSSFRAAMVPYRPPMVQMRSPTFRLASMSFTALSFLRWGRISRK